MIDHMERIEGPNLTLRLITPADAEYVHGLRTNPPYNFHLSEVRGTVADQYTWIEAYKIREAARQEFYYIITRQDGTRCGTVRLYEITRERLTWGSWILDQNKPPKAALESALLSFEVAFDRLGLTLAQVNVRRANAHAEAFYRRFGMVETHSTKQDTFFIYTREKFEADKDDHLHILRAAERMINVRPDV